MSSTTPGIHWRKVHKRKNEHLLFAEDLDGRDSIDVEVVDSGVMVVSGMDGDKDMPWIAFRGAKKRLALNPTNCKSMVTLTGTGIVQDWRGWITLVVVKTTYRDKLTKKNEITDAIRIAPTRPARKSPGPASNAPPKSEPADQPTAPPDEAELEAIAARDREEAGR